MAIAAGYFSGVGFACTFLEQLLVGVITLAVYLLAARRGVEPFSLVVGASVTLSASLGCAFYNVSLASGPLTTSFALAPYSILTLTLAATLGIWYLYEHLPSQQRYSGILLGLFILNWCILAFNVRFFDDWKMENWLTVPFVVLMYATHRMFRLSNISYALMFVYIMLHIYGSHYTYAEVPFGYWMQDVFTMTRNHYDRIVHFSFGFLLAYPIRELVVRVSNTRGVWGFWFPVEFVLAFSCVYELLEWWVAVMFGGDLGIAYLGTQGDVWDAQKDMFLAGLGSVIAMLLTVCIVWYYRRGDFLYELRESLRVKQRAVLGEEALSTIRAVTRKS